MADEQPNIDNDQNPAGLSDTELTASEKGWVPEDQWEGDSDQWRPAKEFLDRGELMDRISSQSKQLQKQTSELDDLKVGFKTLAEHNKKISEQEYGKALAELKRQKADALDMGDHHTVVDIDEQMSDLKESKKEIDVEEAASAKSQEQSRNEPHPDVEAWMGKNTWYNNDIVLQGAADAIAKQYLANNPASHTDPGVVLNHVSQQILKEFPDRFSTGKKRPNGTNEPSSNGAAAPKGGKGKVSMKSLTQEQQKVCRSFVSTGVMSEQEYVDQLVALGEIG